MTNDKVIENIKQQIASNPILIYMKGTPENPMCRFSTTAVNILIDTDKEFGFVNILDFPDIRATLPTISDWPTYPQIFVNGELIGGADILVEMDESGELAEIIKDIP